VTVALDAIAADRWDAFAATNSGDHSQSSEGEPQYQRILNDLCSLFSPDDDGELPPTEHAFQRAVELIEQTDEVMYSHFDATDGDPWWEIPKGYVATDDNQGIRIEWWHGRSACVAVSIGPTPDKLDTTFVKTGPGDPGKLTRIVHPAWLAAKLCALQKTILGDTDGD
jgi:hypothetical protein